MGALIFLFWIFCAICAAAIASGKNRSAFGWFLLGIIFGPFAFVVALMEKIPSNSDATTVNANTDTTQAITDERKCPFCAEMIKIEAIKCRHCGSMIEQKG